MAVPFTDSETEESDNDLQTKRLKYSEFITLITCFAHAAEEASKNLNDLADKIDEHFRKCNRGKIAGSAASLVGFPLIAVGFGLSFVTFGASLGLSIAGAVLSGAGGITAAGSGLAEHFITKAKCKTAQEAIDAVREKAREIKEGCEKVENMAPTPCSATFNASSLTENVASSVGIPAIKPAGAVTDDAAETVFKGLETGLRVLHIGGIVVSSLLVPYDIYTLATSSVKEHRKTGSPQANKIRELAKEMHCLAQDTRSDLVEIDQI
ncbi:uncharacterized protein LOC106169414 [Lingula anatina]|uniref:Uncharacterized protein LOC106169414 n=1 Tax=Lingula anatina TaxID=7574 RepID=A0A1S3J236_LINAN|nr:uncharacterized protein LOC106169414 [Lingula anatina]|eukprot:XP_013404326.1 uncharacterized protein LOC106169414 [Lingula anatina]